MQSSLINQAVHGCEELQNLVSNVLDTLRGDIREKTPTLEIFAIATVAREVIDLFEPQKRLDFHIHLDIPESLFVLADKQCVHQVLLNLFSNAFEHSPKHTAVVVSAQRYDNSTANEHTQSQVCISVKDAGLGIPPSEIPVLFGKFVRLKRDLVGSVRGTGLGLYISKQLVVAMGGDIWVDSTGIAGQGSRFCFTLPYAVPSAIEQNNHTTNAPTDLLPLTSTRIAPGEELSDAAKSKKSE